MPITLRIAVAALALCLTIPASAAPKHRRAPSVQQCSGYLTALENGQCVHTEWLNPDRVPPALNCGSAALCYRGGRQKRHRS
jgi:hypothetical protein